MSDSFWAGQELDHLSKFFCSLRTFYAWNSRSICYNMHFYETRKEYWALVEMFGYIPVHFSRIHCLLTAQYVPSNDLFDCWVSPMTSSHAEWHHALLLTVAKLHALGGWTLLLTFVLKDDIDRTLSTQWLQLWESCIRPTH